jgi:hypothetical protein
LSPSSDRISKALAQFIRSIYSFNSRYDEGIEATQNLALSNNTKIVLIGAGRDGLPLILNAESPQPPVLPDKASSDNGTIPPVPAVEPNISNIGPKPP